MKYKGRKTEGSKMWTNKKQAVEANNKDKRKLFEHIKRIKYQKNISYHNTFTRKIMIKKRP